MDELDRLINETRDCVDAIKSHPRFPESFKNYKVKIASGASLGGKVPHPPKINVVGNKNR